MLLKIKQNLKLVVAGMAALGLLVVPVAVVGQTSAQTPNIQQSTCDGANLSFNTGGTCTGSESRLNSLIATIINIFSVIVGVVAVIMIIVGGFRYITSGGDSGNVTGAKNTIIYAIVGLIIVALAQFIVKFVLNKATTNA